MIAIASTTGVDRAFALVMAFLLMSWVAWHVRDYLERTSKARKRPDSSSTGTPTEGGEPNA